jgi:hypothetical protein
MRALYLPLVKCYVQFPFVPSFQTISSGPRFCEILLDAVSCYGVEFLATPLTNKVDDTPCRMSAVHSICYQIPFKRGRHLIHRILRTRRTVMTCTHLIRLMIHSNYHHNYHHQLTFSVTVTVLLKIFIHYPELTSITNALKYLSIIDSVLILIVLLIPISYSVDS